MFWPVAAPSSAPNMTVGVRQAKNMKKAEAIICGWRASRKSLKYHGTFRFTSAINPPNNLNVTAKDNSVNGEMSTNDWILQYRIIQFSPQKNHNSTNRPVLSSVGSMWWLSNSSSSPCAPSAPDLFPPPTAPLAGVPLGITNFDTLRASCKAIFET